MAVSDVRNMIIGSIMFVVVITGGMFFISGFNSFNPSLDTSNQANSFNSTFNQAQQVTNAANKIQDSVSGVSSSGAGFLGAINALISSAYNGLSAMFGSLSFLNSMMIASTHFFGFDLVTPMIVLIGLVLVIIIGFAIWSAATRAP